MIGFLAERDAGGAKQLGGELHEYRGDPALACHGGGDPDILLQQRETKRPREGAGQDPFRKEILRRIAAPAGRVDDIKRERRVHAGAHQRRQPFGQRPDVHRQHGIVHRLQRVSGTDRAAVHDLLAEQLEDRPHAVECGGVTAAHDRQSPLLRPGYASAHGRIHERHTTFGKPPRNGA